MTDPIADLLTRVRNASQARHDDVSIPASSLKGEVARILKEEGFVEDYEVVSSPPGDTIRIRLKYGDDRSRAITGLRRVSKPGLRVYAKSESLPRVLGGLGVAILSTSQGVITDREARRRRVGGEVLAYVW